MDVRVEFLNYCEIWIAGPQDFDAFKNKYTKFGNCFIGVCSVGDFQTVKSLRERVGYITKIKDRLLNDFPMLFVINKTDLLEEIKGKEVIENYRKEIFSIIEEFSLLNTSILETSAKKRESVTKIYEEI
ncbi:predicted protein [Naegleria gruberi]|uniref:Predicted protein n=1 Tax=Naegleria gruberi TaxID=5762 RepID=D2W368_NAEGR|nr:uncharacterized protein NAEGRDRAFT_75839 [Naegleria gruberi]EFC36434.1 predicted protein [Naegleria gruberi]|eukprot:XP_002669178.1 predicted protein [Naegleria gruberi strain NEG-M]